MRTLIAFLATIAGSAAFQMSVDAGYLKNYAWAVPWVWALCLALWGLWLVMHQKVHQEWFRSFHDRIGRWIIVLRIALFVGVFFCVGYLVKGIVKKPIASMTAKADGKQQEQPPKQEDKKDNKKEQDAKKSAPKPKLKVEQPNISVGNVEQGPCSNLQIGSSGTQTVNCGPITVNQEPLFWYEFNGTKHSKSGPMSSAGAGAENSAYVELMQLEKAGDWDVLRDYAEKQINEYPNWWTPFVLDGKAYASLGNLDKAIEEMSHGLDLAKGTPSASEPQYRLAVQMLAECRSRQAAKKNSRP